MRTPIVIGKHLSVVCTLTIFYTGMFLTNYSYGYGGHHGSGLHHGAHHGSFVHHPSHLHSSLYNHHGHGLRHYRYYKYYYSGEHYNWYRYCNDYIGYPRDNYGYYNKVRPGDGDAINYVNSEPYIFVYGKVYEPGPNAYVFKYGQDRENSDILYVHNETD